MTVFCRMAGRCRPETGEDSRTARAGRFQTATSAAERRTASRGTATGSSTRSRRALSKVPWEGGPPAAPPLFPRPPSTGCCWIDRRHEQPAHGRTQRQHPRQREYRVPLRPAGGGAAPCFPCPV